MLKVLGKTFISNDERREYFRNELRAKLPELKKIEGFPIGEDDDVIALSDPPFYTACPNPWLNDFIVEWEKEKENIPNRLKDFHVSEPYASDVSEGKNNPIYNAHSYHTKVPHPAIMRYILHYTQPGDIVLDGFAGTGMTGVAAQLCGNSDAETKSKIEREWKEQFGENEKPRWGARKAICGDLSPIASFIAYNYNTPIDVEAFEREAKRILAETEEECGWMYTTLHCPSLYNAEQVVKQREAIGQRSSTADLERIADLKAKFQTFENALIEKLRPQSEPKELFTQVSFDNLTAELGLSKGFVQPAKINYTVWSDVFICSNCGEEIVYWDAAVDHTNGEVNDEFACQRCETILTKRMVGKAQRTVFDSALNQTVRQAKSVPVLVNYTAVKTRTNKHFSDFDQYILDKIEATINKYWFPTDLIMGKEGNWGDTWRSGYHLGITHVHHFYTLRNLISYASFWSKVNGNLSVKLALTSYNIHANKMRRYQPVKPGGTPGLNGTLFVSSIPVELSLFDGFPRKLSDIVKAFSQLTEFQQITTLQSATDFSSIFNNSIDYIFTDPPFGSNIMYSELNFLWESWLKVKTNNKTEAIENKVQGKTLLDYQELMMRCFQEYNRVLKPGRWMTVEFSNTGAAVWNGIQTALQRAGFVIANVAALDKKQGSFKAVTTPTAVKQDLVISCYKPSEEFETKFEALTGATGVWEFVREHLEHLPPTIKKAGKSTAVVERSPKILYDRLITFYLMRNLPVPIDAADFQAGLRQKFDERDGMFFTKEDAAKYDEEQGIANQKGEQLRLVFDLIYSESDAVLWLQDRLKKRPQTYQDIQPDYRKANVANRKGEIPTELGTLLEENFIQMPDNRWRVPDLNEAKDREALRKKALMREFGDYVTLASGGKKLKEVRVEALRVGFKDSWERKDFKTIIAVADKIPNNILLEDEQLLMYYDIAQNFV
jgi:DNA modification methylase